MVSSNIERFLRFHDEAQIRYKTAYDNVNKCDKLTQDLLHKLELDDLTTGEKNKIATQLKYCRKDRRYWKDIVEEYEPFIMLFNTKVENKRSEAEFYTRFIRMLREALGSTRRQEAYHADRHYKPRIIVEENKQC